MSIKKSFLFSILLAGCFLLSGPLANAAEVDTDVGCRTAESLAAFQNEAEPSLLAGADVNTVYENTLLFDDVLAHLCIVADVGAFTVGKDLGGGFSEATLINGAQVEHLIVATPMMDDVGGDIVFVTDVQSETVIADEPVAVPAMPVVASMIGLTVTEVSEKTDMPPDVWAKIRPGIPAGTFRKVGNILYMEPQQ